MKQLLNYLILSLSMLLLAACEKEITVDLPPSKPNLIVEASINQQFPNLNYVYLSRSVDYFNPDLSLNGVRNALVFITPGNILGGDTIWDEGARVQMIDINTIPGIDLLLPGFSGIYFSTTISPQIGVPYKLEITTETERAIGYTSIPKVVEIDTIFWRQDFDTQEGDTDMYVTFEFTDGPEQNNYRLAIQNGFNPYLLGWGSASQFRNFDDGFLNNGVVPYSFFRPFNFGDTLSLYLTSIGRKEYSFWESFSRAANNGGPFATPVSVKSNIEGAIGSFTGYGVSFRSVIIR
jgi:hypothetical protein